MNIKCAYCGITNVNNFIDQNNSIFICCNKCNSLTLFPQISESDLLTFYTETYYGGINKSKFNILVQSIVNYFCTIRLSSINKLLPDRARILDIGCGNCTALNYFHKMNHEVFGVERYSGYQRALKFADFKIKKNIIDQDILIIPFDNNSFDCIIIWHVLEHMNRPIEVLNKIFDILKSDGILSIAVPVSDSLEYRLFKKHWFHLDPPRHLCIPSWISLINVCTNMGFECIEKKYFCFEYNFFGVLQSLYNQIGFKRDSLYDFLKFTSISKLNVSIILQILILPFIILIASVIFLLEVYYEETGCVELVFKKPHH